MNLKTYRAPSMAEALALVKRELGKDAVILNTRSTRVGGVFGFFAKTVVEVTASDQGALFAKRSGTGGGGTGRGGGAEFKAPAGSAQQRSTNSSSTTARSEVASGLRAAAAESWRAERAQTASVPRFPVPQTDSDPLAALYPRPSSLPVRPNATTLTTAPVAVASIPSEPVRMPVRNSTGVPVHADGSRQTGSLNSGPGIERELAAIKLMVSQVLQSSPTAGFARAGGAGAVGGVGATPGGMSDPLFEHYLQLLQSQMARTIVDEIVGKVRDELSPGELSDPSIVRTAVLRHLGDLVPVCGGGGVSKAISAQAGAMTSARVSPYVVALIGPTGVGKTTTTAKLAAAFKLRHGRNVALITTDTYRIAAVDQLRTYANIIGLPLKVVMSPQEMAAAMVELAGYDVVLIDTAGRSQHNADRLEELAGFLEAARPDETHLVLSCASSEDVLIRTAEAFAPARPTRILFSKLDEAVNFGLIVNVIRGVSERLGQTPVSYVTTGQEVPDHIEPGRADRLARMVLDNKLEHPAQGPVRYQPSVEADPRRADAAQAVNA